jgi:hypothetical protein
MARVDTAPVAAEMVDVEAVGDAAVSERVHEAVSRQVAVVA